MRALGEKLLQIAEQFFIACLGRAVEPDKARAFDQANIARITDLVGEARKQVETATQQLRADRLREVHHDRESRFIAGGVCLCSDCFNGLLYSPGAQSDFDIAHLWTGDGEHQGGGVAKVFNEVNRPGIVRQVVDAVELELDVVKLFSAVLDFLVQFQVDHRYAGARDGFDLDHLGVFGDLGFELLSDQILDLLSARAGPGRQRDGYPHGHFGVFALRHAEIAVDAPKTRSD